MKNNHTAIILVVIFFSLLLLPQVLALFVHNSNDVTSENRNLTRFPRLKWSRFAKGFEEYYNDRIPFRSQLLACCGTIQDELFSFPMGGVIPGKDDFCFYIPNNEQNSFMQYRGKINFTQYQLEKNCAFLEKVHRILQEKNIEFLFVVAPDKIQVYPELLPARRRYAQAPDAPFLQLREYLEKSSSPVPRLFLLDDLLEAKKIYGQDLYYHNDSHWNRVGGYIGAAAVIRRFSPDAKLPRAGEFKVITDNNTIEPSDMKAQLIRADFMKDHPDKYPDVPGFQMSPARDYWVSKNPDAPDKRKVMIFRDSFALNMSPWLSQHFAEVHYVWSYYISMDRINKVKPDIVILEHLSRLLIDMKSKFR